MRACFPATLPAHALILWIRHMEDFVTWVDTSKLKRTVMRYNDEVIVFLILVKVC